jgi:hypothetical protein
MAEQRYPSRPGHRIGRVGDRHARTRFTAIARGGPCKPLSPHAADRTPQELISDNGPRSSQRCTASSVWAPSGSANSVAAWGSPRRVAIGSATAAPPRTSTPTLNTGGQAFHERRRAAGKPAPGPVGGQLTGLLHACQRRHAPCTGAPGWSPLGDLRSLDD